MKILRVFLILSSLIIFLNADDDDDKYKHSYKSLDYLHLNKTQTVQIKEILIKYKYKFEEFYDYKEDQEDILENIMENDIFDKEKYISILNDVKSKAIILEAAKMEEIHKILNEKQREKFSKYMKEWEID